MRMQLPPTTNGPGGEDVSSFLTPFIDASLKAQQLGWARALAVMFAVNVRKHQPGLDNHRLRDILEVSEVVALWERTIENQKASALRTLSGRPSISLLDAHLTAGFVRNVMCHERDRLLALDDVGLFSIHALDARSRTMMDILEYSAALPEHGGDGVSSAHLTMGFLLSELHEKAPSVILPRVAH